MLTASRSTAPARLTRAKAQVLSGAKVDALLAPLEAFGTFVVAVSGGPDSIALLLMAAGWAKRRGAALSAATVDHGLRPESAAEAEGVADLCARLGVPHVTLVWEGKKPATRLQERAREARYRLLAAHAGAVGARAVATAHHADDQAETVLFRLLRGSGVAGLAGMEMASVRGGITLVRPLLQVPKVDLVAYLRAHKVAYVEDPSNDDPRFARTRLRSLMRRLADEGLDAAGMARFARRAAEAGAALDWAADAVESQFGRNDPLEAGALFAAPAALVQRVLARRIAAAGADSGSRIGLEKIEALAAALAAAHAERCPFGANLGGALVRLSAKGTLSVVPEPPRRAAHGRVDAASEILTA